LRRGGSQQVFCDRGCRAAFHTAARRWAERAVAKGLLTATDLRNDPAEACTLLPRAQSPAPLPEIRSADPALLAVLRRRGTISVTVLVAPEGIADLVTLGWIDRRRCRDAVALADAVVALASAALDTRLPPG
jgi:hypothetical protein